MAGFFVWNPAGRTPTYVHPTLESATAEAERLTIRNPGERFYVMAPVVSEDAARAAKVFSQGMAAGRAEWAARSVALENRARAADERLGRFRYLDQHVAGLRAVVADCLLWFDGFSAAFAHREDWERPRVPNRDELRRLNTCLQEIEGLDQSDDDRIPF